MSDAQTQAQILMLKGALSDLPAEQQATVQAARQKLTEAMDQLVEEHGELTLLGVALATAEFIDKHDKE